VIVGSAIGLGAFQVIGTFGAAANQGDSRGIDALAIILVVLGPAALAVRDRWPLPAVALSIAAADLYLGLGYPLGPILISPIVAVIYAVLVGRRRPTWAIVGVGYVGLTIAALLSPHPHGSALALISGAAVWIALIFAVAELIRSRRDVFAQRARVEAERRERAESDQRLALAQELHDVLAHHISLINVQAGVALHLMDSQPERVGPALADIKEASREALRELRGALDVLRGGEQAPRAPAPTLADLDRLIDAVAASGLRISLDDPRAGRDVASLPAAVQLAAYRIVQEALTNVSRHSGARAASIRLRYPDAPEGDLTIEVVDDGIGGSAAAGNGISGMRERAASLGGTLAAEPAEGGGFRVAARLPVRAPAGSPPAPPAGSPPAGSPSAGSPPAPAPGSAASGAPAPPPATVP
jgi:signal transduction histidine kinase